MDGTSRCRCAAGSWYRRRLNLFRNPVLSFAMTAAAIGATISGCYYPRTYCPGYNSYPYGYPQTPGTAVPGAVTPGFQNGPLFPGNPSLYEPQAPIDSTFDEDDNWDRSNGQNDGVYDYDDFDPSNGVGAQDRINAPVPRPRGTTGSDDDDSLFLEEEGDFGDTIDSFGQTSSDSQTSFASRPHLHEPPGSPASTTRLDPQQANPIHYDFDERDYRWLQGIVNYEHDDQTWSIIYNMKGDDRYFGDFLLIPDPAFDEEFRVGDFVRLQGHIDTTQLETPRKPMYRVDRYHILNTGI